MGAVLVRVATTCRHRPVPGLVPGAGGAVNELSLFTGAGGGVLASILLGWHTVGYVEYDDYCQKIIRQRIKDGIYDDAPIFGDIKGFDGKPWRGVVDCVTAGFPCQPFSVAGKRAGADDPRNMWPETLRTIRDVRPRYAFLENVPGLISSRYFDTILTDLASSGYDAEWCVLGADDVGAPHRRKRLWILADTSGIGSTAGISGQEPGQEGDAGEFVNRGDEARVTWWDTDPADVDDAEVSERGAVRQDDTGRGTPEAGRPSGGEEMEDAEYAGVQRGAAQGRETQTRRNGATTRPSGRSVEPRLGRVAYGVANRVNRLKAIGNGQVPAVAVAAWHLLMARGARG